MRGGFAKPSEGWARVVSVQVTTERVPPGSRDRRRALLARQRSSHVRAALAGLGNLLSELLCDRSAYRFTYEPAPIDASPVNGLPESLGLGWVHADSDMNCGPAMWTEST